MDHDDFYRDQLHYNLNDPRNPGYTDYEAYSDDRGYSDHPSTGTITDGNLIYGAMIFLLAGLASAYLLN